MFLSIRDKEKCHLAIRTHVIDVNTGERIPYVIWANDESGTYRRHLTDKKGNLITNKKKTKILSKRFKRNIKLEFDNNL